MPNVWSCKDTIRSASIVPDSSKPPTVLSGKNLSLSKQSSGWSIHAWLTMLFKFLLLTPFPIVREGNLPLHTYRPHHLHSFQQVNHHHWQWSQRRSRIQSLTRGGALHASFRVSTDSNEDVVCKDPNGSHWVWPTHESFDASPTGHWILFTPLWHPQVLRRHYGGPILHMQSRCRYFYSTMSYGRKVERRSDQLNMRGGGGVSKEKLNLQLWDPQSILCWALDRSICSTQQI